MREYNIATLIKIVMDIIAERQYTTGKILLEAVAGHPNVNVNVDDRMISNLVSNKKRAEVHGEIKAGALSNDVAEHARKELERELLPKISPLRMDDLCTKIIETMRADKDVSDGFCNKMQQLYADGNYLEFITNADLYALSVSNLPKEDIVSSDNIHLLAQSNYKCPLDGAPLWRKKSGSDQYIYSFQIVKIYPDDLPLDLRIYFEEIQPEPRSLDSMDNRIALCKKCAERYISDPTPEMYKKLLECKNHIIIKQKNERISAESSVEDEIVDIIRAIANLDGSTELEPFTDVLRIKEKVRPENYLLGESIQDDVVKYYPFIQEQFSILDGAGNTSFDVIRSEVKVCYKKYEQAGLTQQEIYEALIDWLIGIKGMSDKYKLAAGVIISFFVQNCAVFQRYQHEGGHIEEEDE